MSRNGAKRLLYVMFRTACCGAVWPTGLQVPVAEPGDYSGANGGLCGALPNTASVVT
jgi:hypothetical protein